jgi:hypothetical protein
MYFNAFGCEGWGDYNASVAHDLMGNPTTTLCEHEANPWFAYPFFCIYVLTATYLLLNVFVGIIVNSTLKAASEVEEKKREAHAWAVATRQRAVDAALLAKSAKSEPDIKLLNPLNVDGEAE